MKQSIVYVILIISFNVTLSLSSQQLPVTDGLIGYWPLNNHVQDVSGQKIHGNINGADFTVDRNGNINNALNFDGENDYVIFINDDILNNTFDNGITIAVWIKLNVAPIVQGESYNIISKGNAFTSSSPSPFALTFFHTNNTLYFDLWNSSLATPRSYLISTKDDWQTGQWYHIVATWDGTISAGSQKIYIDGVLHRQRTSGVDELHISSDNLKFGCSNLSAINGDLDEIMIFNRGISADEVLDIYNYSGLSTWKNSSNGLYYDNGNIGIGNLPLQDYRLAVDGDIIAKEIKVEATPWSDFVFDDDYNLQNLKEVEQYIETENHLPGVPSASEVEEKGINVAEMNTILLQKIEEMTLYIIELNKRLEAQEARNKKLEKEVSELKKTK